MFLREKMITVKPPNFRELGDARFDEVLRSYSCEVGVPLDYGVHWAVLLSLLLHHGQETSALEVVLKKITGKKCIDKRLIRKVSNSVCGFNPFLDRFALFYDVALKNVVKAFFQESLHHREKYIQQKIKEKDFPDHFQKKSKTEFWIDTIGDMLKCDIYFVHGDSCENVYISRCSKGSSDESNNHDNVKESSSKFDTGVKILLFGERKQKILFVTSFGLSEERGKELQKLSTESIEKLFENFQGRGNAISNFYCLEEVNQKLISIWSNAASWKKACDEKNNLVDVLKSSLGYKPRLYRQRIYHKENMVLLYLIHENCMFRIFDVSSSTDELKRKIVDFHFKMDAIFQSLTQVQDNRSIKLLDAYDFEMDFLKKFTAVNEPLESEDLKKKLHDIFQTHFGHFASEKHRGIRDFEEQTSYLFFTMAILLCDRFSESFLEEEMQTNFIHTVFLCLQHCIWGRKSSFFPIMRTFFYEMPEEFGRRSIATSREGKETRSTQGPLSVKEVLSEHFVVMRLKHYLHLASTADFRNNFMVSCLVVQRAVQVLLETVKRLRGQTLTISNMVAHYLEPQLEELRYAHGILCPESPDYVTTRMRMENNANFFLVLQHRLVRICNSMTWFFTFQSKRAKTYYLQSVTSITLAPEEAPKVGPLSYECMKIVLAPKLESFHIKNFLLYADALLREDPKKDSLIRHISGLFGSLHELFHCMSIHGLYLDVYLRERRQSEELLMFRAVLNATLKQHKETVSLVFPYISVTKTLDKKVLDKLDVKKAQTMPEQHLFRKESHSRDEKVRVELDSSTKTDHKTDQHRPSCKGNLGVEAQSMTFFREKSYDDSEMSSSKATGQVGLQCSAIATSVLHRKMLLKSEIESMSASPKSSFRDRAYAELLVKKARTVPEQHLFRMKSHSRDEKVRGEVDLSTIHRKTDQCRPSSKGNLCAEAQCMTLFREKTHDVSEMSSSKETGLADLQRGASATRMVHRKMFLESKSEAMSASLESRFSERIDANLFEEPKVLHASKRDPPGARFWFLLDRIKKLKNLLIDSNDFSSTMWDKVKSEKAKDFVRMQLVSMYSSQPSLQASLEALLFDCMNLIEDNDSEMGSSLGHLWQKIDNVFNSINIRNYFADVDARFRIVGKAFDNFCLSNEVIKVALKLVSEIDKLEAIYKMKIEVSSDYETLVVRIENDDYDEYFSTLCKTIKSSSTWKLYVKMATQ